MASIFRVEKYASEGTQSAATCSGWSSLGYYSTLEIEAIHSSETLIHTKSARSHIPEDGILHNHLCENHKSYM
jgi:hypothetical protein